MLGYAEEEITKMMVGIKEAILVLPEDAKHIKEQLVYAYAFIQELRTERKI